jgi:hypothetical protein
VRLLEELKDGVCVASFVQWLVVILMPLTPVGDASFALLGPLTANTIGLMRLMKLFMGIEFRLKEDVDERVVPWSKRKRAASAMEMEGDSGMEEDDNSADSVSQQIGADPVSGQRMHFTKVEVSVLGRGFPNLARKVS